MTHLVLDSVLGEFMTKAAETDISQDQIIHLFPRSNLLKSYLKKLARNLLPYRIYFVLFELQEQVALLWEASRRNDASCCNLARSFIRKGVEMEYPGGSAALRMHELKVFSQNGEDGMLMYIFARIGTTDKRFVEFGVEDGRECNSANLLINLGWSGLLMDGSDEHVSNGMIYYRSILGRELERLQFKRAFITAENVNDLLAEGGMEGEIDLLSIDVDGNDYWIWKAIDRISPRVVVAEYNASFGPIRRVTIPYRPNFIWNSRSYPELLYTGASLALLNELGDEKGYMLVGCDSNGVNAFFVRKNVAMGKLSPVSVEDVFRPHATRTVRFSQEEQERATRSFSLVER
jgi:hypothetical protein